MQPRNEVGESVGSMATVQPDLLYRSLPDTSNLSTRSRRSSSAHDAGFEEPIGPHGTQKIAPVSIIAAASNLTMTAMGVGILALASTMATAGAGAACGLLVAFSLLTFVSLRLLLSSGPPGRCTMCRDQRFVGSLTRLGS